MGRPIILISSSAIIRFLTFVVIISMMVYYKDGPDGYVTGKELEIIEEEQKSLSDLQYQQDPIESCRMRDRLDAIKRYCANEKSLDEISKDTLEHLLVDDSLELMYCYVPKASSSSLKQLMVLRRNKSQRVIEDIESNWEVVHNRTWLKKVGLNVLADYSEDEIASKLNKYKKFAIVRNPFSRLYSAYTDKFLRNYDRHAGLTYKFTLPAVFPHSPVINGSTFLTFKEFVDFIVLTYTNWTGTFYRSRHDEHWMRQIKLCDPCQVQYDHIAKVETLNLDKREIMKMLRTHEMPEINVRTKQQGKRNKFNAKELGYMEAYGTVSEGKISTLKKVYRQDLQAFGYNFDKQQGPSCTYEERYLNNRCC